MAGLPAEALSEPGEGGSLASNKFLGISIDSLCDGVALRKLAIAGAIALAIGFLIPMAPSYQRQWPWELLGGGAWLSLSLLFPIIAAAVGLAAVLLRKLKPVAVAAMLCASGVIGLALCIPGLGDLAGTPSKLMPLLALGLVAAGSALVVRSVDPDSGLARKTLAAGAGLAVVGLLIPLSDAYQFLPTELWFYIDTEKLGSASPLGAYADAFNRDPIVFFSALYLMLPAVLLPIAAAIAWPRPRSHWDGSGLVLRPIAAVVLLYVPIGFALYLFNMMGLSDNSLVYLHGDVLTFEEFSGKLMIGRAKLLVLGGGFAMWAQLGGAVLLRARSSRNPPGDRTRRTGSESAPE